MAISRRKRWRRLQQKAFFTQLRQVSLPFFRSEYKRRAIFLSLLLLSLLFAVSGVNVLISYLSRDFMSALADRQGDDFMAILPKYLGAFLIATLISVAYRYTEERFALAWRRWMTNYLIKRYFFRRSYYHLRSAAKLDNPDQRIAEDIKNFTATTLSLILILINSIMTVIAFSGVLASISWYLVFVLVGYAVFGTLSSYVIGRRLVRLHNRQYRFEANLRYGLIRVRDNAESIAFFRGEPRERIDLIKRVEAVVRNTLSLINWNRNLAFFTTGYNYLALLIPTLVVAPMYFKGEVQFGVITQAQGAFAQVLAALSVIITQFERISAYAAGVGRAGMLWEALIPAETENDDDDDPIIEVEEGTRLRLSELTVQPPRSPRILVNGLNFVLPSGGKGLLIMGESGSGKSSILRTIAGLWSSGEGSIVRPRLAEMMFLPQRPYMPPGSLRAQLLYPNRTDSQDISDDQLKEALEKVNLKEIIDRFDGNFGVKMEWGNVLSLGEQQRLSFARLILRNPTLAFLDEATSALDENNERLLYAQLREMGVSFVSVGHRSTLIEFHDLILSLDGKGGWNVQAASSFEQQRA